jgi:hypothetical protein
MLVDHYVGSYGYEKGRKVPKQNRIEGRKVFLCLTDSNLLWLKCEGDATPHHWYQHEKDGYYHKYTGLYLTRENVLKAQKLLQEHCNLHTTITSHYATSAIIRRYVGWDS